MKKEYLKIIYKIISIIISLTIIILSIGSILKKDILFSKKENRLLTQLPALSFDSIISRKFMTDFENYSAEQFIGRDNWITIKTSFNSILGNTKSNGVYKGKKGYLLEDIVTPNKENLDKNILAINDFVQKNKLKTYMMVVPNIAGIFNQYLPLFAPVRNQYSDLKYLKESIDNNIEWVDIREKFLQHKDEQLYYYTDHHWTTLGAYYAFCELAKHLNNGADAFNYEHYYISNDFVGSLASKSGFLPEKKDTIQVFVADQTIDYTVEYVEEQEKTATVYKSEMLESNDPYTVFFGGNYPLIEINTTQIDKNNLLIIKDSYANSLVPFLIPYYKKIVMVDPRYYYNNLSDLIKQEDINEILFLYNANTFFEDNSLNIVLES